MRTIAKLTGLVLVLTAGCPKPQPQPTLGPGAEEAIETAASLAALHNLDFENGLALWTADGDAFAGQPVVGDAVLTEQSVHVPIGGDYWKHLPFPVGQHGARWVSSAFVRAAEGAPRGQTRGDAPVGTLTSSEMKLPDDARFMHVAVGGGRSPEWARVELQIDARGADLAALARCDAAHAAEPLGGPVRPRDGDFVAAYVFAGDGVTESLIPHVVEICPAALGRRARIRVVDRSATAHVNVDDIFFAAARPAPRAQPVWGFADYHTHPTAHLGFGGLRGIHTLWGSPGTRADEYKDVPDLVRRDIPKCADVDGQGLNVGTNAHHGGLLAPKMINAAENRMSPDIGQATRPESNRHQPNGSDDDAERDYASFPGFLWGAHQQYHVTQLRRAHEGGLRLVAALAVHNPALEYGMGWVAREGQNPIIRVTPDVAVIEAHVAAMRKLARMNAGWMEIAYSPADARRIIRSDRLAVVLGVEVDQLGKLRPTITEELDHLVEMGIRQVTPIHAIDNALGAPAVFQDLYNTENDWLNRAPELRTYDGPNDGPFYDARRFFQVRHDEPCGPGRPPGECVLFRLSSQQNRLMIELILSPTDRHPFLLSGVPERQYDGPGGHLNAGGLTEAGRSYLRGMMSRGMLVDVAHMSDRSVRDAFAMAASAGSGYPVMISHAGYRELAMQADYSDLRDQLVKGVSVADAACILDPEARCPAALARARQRIAAVLGAHPGPGTMNRGLLPKEFDVTTRQADHLKEIGGVIGPFAGQDPVRPSADLPFADDCAMSSKGFAAAFLFAARHEGPAGVGIATDFGFHATVAPRFGPWACAAYTKVSTSLSDRLLEVLLNRDQYRFSAQRRGVAYEGLRDPAVPDFAGNEPLVPYEMGRRKHDFNVHGLAHVGLVPDMLQDVKNLGVDLAPLFSSAEGYIRMWERAWTAAGCDRDGHCNPSPRLRDENACGEGCPDAWNAGAPLQSLGRRVERCSSSRSVRIEGGTPMYGPAKVTDDERYTVYQVSQRPIRWRCEDSLEGSISCNGQPGSDRSCCPAGTRYVKVRRGENRAVFFECLAAPYEPARPRRAPGDKGK